MTITCQVVSQIFSAHVLFDARIINFSQQLVAVSTTSPQRRVNVDTKKQSPT